MQRAIFIDRGKCVGCDACVVACKLEHGLPPAPERPPAANPEGPELIRVYQIGPEMRGDEVRQYFQPISCMHCLDAPCIKACPRAAIYRDSETGATLTNPDKCIGCKFCLWVCPYGAPQFCGDKMCVCDLCIDRFRDGRGTACEAACQARAIHVGTTDSISALIGEKAASGSRLRD